MNIEKEAGEHQLVQQLTGVPILEQRVEPKKFDDCPKTFFAGTTRKSVAPT